MHLSLLAFPWFVTEYMVAGAIGLGASVVVLVASSLPVFLVIGIIKRLGGGK